MNEYNRRKKQIQDSENTAIEAMGTFVVLVIILSIVSLITG